MNRSREVCEWEGWVWVSEAGGAPSMLRLIRRSVVNQMNCTSFFFFSPAFWTVFFWFVYYTG